MKFRTEEEILTLYKTLGRDNNIYIPNKPLSILELGCRDGKGSIEFVKSFLATHTNNIRYIGIDHNKQSITEAKNNLKDCNLPIKFFHKDLEKLELKEKVDIMLIIDQDDYIEPTQEELKHLHEYADQVIVVRHPQYLKATNVYDVDYECMGWYSLLTHNISYIEPHDFGNLLYLQILIHNVNKDKQGLVSSDGVGRNKVRTLAYIVTNGRYHTTLPLAINSLLMSEKLPTTLIIADDNPEGTRIEWGKHPLYSYLEILAAQRGVEFRVLFTPDEGQVKAHSYILKNFGNQYDFIMRMDDDCVIEPFTYGNLLNELMNNPDVGAVGGCIWQPGQVQAKPKWLKGELSNHINSSNIQWCFIDESYDVEILYSSFMYRTSVAIKSDGYNMMLSPLGHTEEAMFSHNIFRMGYKLRIIPDSLMYHLHYPTGGIRQEIDKKYLAFASNNDNAIFRNYVKAVGKDKDDIVFCNLQFGKGDTVMFAMVFDEIAEYWRGKDKRIIVAVEQNGILDQEAIKAKYDYVEFIDLGEAQQHYMARNMIYFWMANSGWNGHFKDGMVKMFTTNYDSRLLYGN